MTGARAAFSGIDSSSRIDTTVVLGVAIEAAIMWRFGVSAALPAYLYLGAVAAVVTMTDLASRRIPRAVTGPSYPIAAALLAMASATDGRWWALATGAIAMGLVAGFYLVLALAFPGQMGGGDVVLGGLLGLYLGWLGWGALATGIICAWLLAALALPVRRVVSRGNRSGALAAGPFLVMGALLAVLASR